MRRRAFTASLGSAITATPLAARAQPRAMPVLGYLGSNSLADAADPHRGTLQGLREGGFVDGQNLAIEYRFVDDNYALLPEKAAELVARRVDVIVAQGPPAAYAARAATSTIPIVFGTGTDPVSDGLVASFARPGGNRTGVAMFMTDLVARRFVLMTELPPRARTFALLNNPNFPQPWVPGIESEARTRGLRLLVLQAGTPDAVDAAFATMLEERVEALVIGQDPFLSLRPQVAALAVRHAIPLMALLRSQVLAGGLATFGINLVEAFRIIGSMAARILKGARPEDLAVQRPTRFEMVLNLKTAAALGLTIPPLLMAQADELLE